MNRGENQCGPMIGSPIVSPAFILFTCTFFFFFWFFFSVLLKVVSSQDFILRAQNILSRFVLLRGPLYVGNSTLPRVSFTISAIPIEKQCYISLQVISKK